MSDWPSRPLRALANIDLGRQRSPQHDQGPYMVPYLRAANVSDGQLNLDDVKEMNFTPDEQRIFDLKPGDVLVTEGSGSLSTVGASAVWRGDISGVVCFQNTLLRLRPRSSATDPRFLEWWCRAAFADRIFASIATGANIFHISAERVRALPIRCPPVGSQRAIADFLDVETARIDALIVKKRCMIELIRGRLDAKSERIILGLEETNSRPSNTGFFSAVPVDWLETQLRHLGCEVQTGPFGSQLHAEDYADSGWPVINPANIKNGKIVGEGTVRVDDETRSRLSRHVLRAGDIVFGRRGEMGRAGLVGREEEGWLCGTGSLRLRLTQSALLPDYLKLLLETTVARNYFQLSSVGSTMDNLNSEILLSMPCLVPPGDRQQAIVSAVIRARPRATATMEAIERQVRLLQEHRQALITAAVTGKLEVRERVRVGA